MVTSGSGVRRAAADISICVVDFARRCGASLAVCDRKALSVVDIRPVSGAGFPDSDAVLVHKQSISSRARRRVHA